MKQHEYINLSILLKGAVELNDVQVESFLGLDKNGHIVPKPKLNIDKISSIEKWTDAFLIFSSIYTEAHPEHSQGLLHYIFIIREAAAKYGVAHL